MARLATVTVTTTATTGECSISMKTALEMAPFEKGMLVAADPLKTWLP
jgi:hypothetical protein